LKIRTLSLYQILGDAGLLALALLVAFGLRFGFVLPAEYIDFLLVFALPILALKLIFLYFFGLYRRFWRYASIGTLRALLQALSLSSLGIVFILYFTQTLALPRSVFVIDWLLSVILLGGVRFFSRSLVELRLYATMPASAHQVLIAGAGDAAEMLVREMLKNQSMAYLPVGLLDNDPIKQGMSIHGIKVLGTLDDLTDVAKSRQLDEVVIAMPSAPKEVKRKIALQCERLAIRCKTLPGVHEILGGQVTLNLIRDVEVEDILGREPVEINLSEISNYLTGERVLVTGAGGSIGSELCRQISQLNPSHIIAVDQAENSLFEIEQELEGRTTVPFMPVVLDIKEADKLEDVFQQYRPAVVFHAAAYKHVPMMERNPEAALLNNFVGTWVVADASLRHGVRKFVLISTDKAVNPQNMMGVSKALAEMTMQALSGEDATRFITVRFGNVLASRGSVVPLFKEQIANGGPVTVTHPEMKRYFMTISEAVQLVIQAGALGKGAEVFVLDMGEQIRIVDLAENMIRLSGFEPERDIMIRYIGVRPGEKLEEELFAPHETKLSTSHPKLFMATQNITDRMLLKNKLGEIRTALEQGRLAPALERIYQMAPSYPAVQRVFPAEGKVDFA
jgi:FlaA1/EpsC-like NDP-sugar epimerase